MNENLTRLPTAKRVCPICRGGGRVLSLSARKKDKVCIRCRGEGTVDGGKIAGFQTK